MSGRRGLDLEDEDGLLQKYLVRHTEQRRQFLGRLDRDGALAGNAGLCHLHGFSQLGLSQVELAAIFTQQHGRGKIWKDVVHVEQGIITLIHGQQFVSGEGKQTTTLAASLAGTRNVMSVKPSVVCVLMSACINNLDNVHRAVGHRPVRVQGLGKGVRAWHGSGSERLGSRGGFRCPLWVLSAVFPSTEVRHDRNFQRRHKAPHDQENHVNVL